MLESALLGGLLVRAAGLALPLPQPVIWPLPTASSLPPSTLRLFSLLCPFNQLVNSSCGQPATHVCALFSQLEIAIRFCFPASLFHSTPSNSVPQPVSEVTWDWILDCISFDFSIVSLKLRIPFTDSPF